MDLGNLLENLVKTPQQMTKEQMRAQIQEGQQYIKTARECFNAMSRFIKACGNVPSEAEEAGIYTMLGYLRCFIIVMKAKVENMQVHLAKLERGEVENNSDQTVQ